MLLLVLPEGNPYYSWGSTLCIQFSQEWLGHQRPSHSQLGLGTRADGSLGVGTFTMGAPR